MRTTNPALNEKVFARETPGATKAGWALPDSVPRPPVDDTVSPWTPPAPPVAGYETMTVGGVISASAVLLALVLAAAWYGWNQVDVQPDEVVIPGWIFVPVLVGLGFAIFTIVKPRYSRITSPLYALAEGVFLGAISHLYEAQWDGIVFQAISLTLGVFALMLFLYATRVIKVTDKLRLGIVAATGAIALVYLVNIVLSLFGADLPFIHQGGAFGILFSLVVVGVAAMNLVLDFDFIERASAANAPKHMEWFGAFGLLVTLVWLYIEMLRLLGQLRN
jgi:uncharacterized YccA/Bax inhibitor family protein